MAWPTQQKESRRLCLRSPSVLVLPQGGKFVLTVKGEDLGQLDQWWLHAVLAAIGETLEVCRADSVSGCYLINANFALSDRHNCMCRATPPQRKVYVGSREFGSSNANSARSAGTLRV